MNYLNRMFFRRDTGELIYRYSRSGTAEPSTIAEDMAAIQPLIDFLPDALICIETPETDLDTITKISTAKSIYMIPDSGEIVYESALDPTPPPAPNLVDRVAAMEDAVLMLMSIMG